MSSLFAPPQLPDVPDPAPVERLAAGVLTLASLLADAGRRLAAVDADWEGSAADSFRAVQALQPRRFDDAAHALVGAVRALTAYADDLRRIGAQVDSARVATVVDHDAAAQQSGGALAAAEAACIDALNAAAAVAPRPPGPPPAPRPNWFLRSMATVFTPTLRMPDSVRTNNGLTGLFGGIAGALLTGIEDEQEPWTNIPYVSAAIRHAGGVEDPAPASARYQLGELAFDVGTAGVGAPEAAVEVERMADEALLARPLEKDVFRGDPPAGRLDKMAYRHQWSKVSAPGHMWSKHIVGTAKRPPDMPFFKTPDEARTWIHTAMRKGELRHGLPRDGEDPLDPSKPWLDRTAYWYRGFLIVVDHRHPDLGTMFVPDRGRIYFEENFR